MGPKVTSDVLDGVVVADVVVILSPRLKKGSSDALLSLLPPRSDDATSTFHISFHPFHPSISGPKPDPEPKSRDFRLPSWNSSHAMLWRPRDIHATEAEQEEAAIVCMAAPLEERFAVERDSPGAKQS